MKTEKKNKNMKMCLTVVYQKLIQEFNEPNGVAAFLNALDSQLDFVSCKRGRKCP